MDPASLIDPEVCVGIPRKGAVDLGFWAQYEDQLSEVGGVVRHDLGARFQTRPRPGVEAEWDCCRPVPDETQAGGRGWVGLLPSCLQYICSAKSSSAATCSHRRIPTAQCCSFRGTTLDSMKKLAGSESRHSAPSPRSQRCCSSGQHLGPPPSPRGDTSR